MPPKDRKAYRQKNRDKILAYARVHYQELKADPERYQSFLATRKRWRIENPEEDAYNQRRCYDRHIEARRKYSRGRYWKNRDTIKQKDRERDDRGKLQVLRHYSGDTLRCECCGEVNVGFLTIDHINGGGTRHRKSMHSHDFYHWLIQHGYPPGYRVLCYNCNMGRARYRDGICPHKKQETLSAP